MNLGELRASLREMLNDVAEPQLWSDDTLNRYLNNAVREACIRARLLKDDADSLPTLCVLNFDSGQARIKHAKEILVVRSGTIDGQCHKLWALTAESLDRREPGWDASAETGTPRYVVMDLAQKTLRLFPTPDVAGVLRLRVWRTPLSKEVMEGDRAEPVIALPDPEELRHWAAHEAYMVKDPDANDPTRSANHLSLFEQRFGARPSLHDMARWADSPPRVRHASMF